MINKKIFKNSATYKLKKGKYIFKKIEASEIVDGLDGFKNKIKKFQKLYYFLIYAISPVYVDGSVRKFLKRFYKKDDIVLNLGSGNSIINKNVINVDIFQYGNVDIVCDISDLPFEDKSIDIILNLAVLEHVKEPSEIIKEVQRVLKDGGIVYTAFPFIQGFHASPYDFTRVTREGILHLHRDFDIIAVKPFGGPTSGMLWILQEWLAIAFSFGNKKIYTALYFLFLILLSPLKFLDYFLIKHPMAKNIASGFACIAKKR